MDITIIGAGNVGTVLSRVLKKAGNNIRQVYSRDMQNAIMLATESGAEAVAALSEVDNASDIYIITVTDDAIPAVAAQLQLGDKLVIHTAGSVSKQVLAGTGTNYGVLWPMKMIRKTMKELGSATIIIDGNTPAAVAKIETIATQLSDDISVANDEQRLKMHAVATIVSNFTNHLYRLAADYCEKEGIDFSAFYPIIEESARQIQHSPPAQVQAGPAFRNNTGTMEKHRQLLSNHPELAGLYDILSDSIMRKAGHK